MCRISTRRLPLLAADEDEAEVVVADADVVGGEDEDFLHPAAEKDVNVSPTAPPST